MPRGADAGVLHPRAHADKHAVYGCRLIGNGYGPCLVAPTQACCTPGRMRTSAPYSEELCDYAGLAYGYHALLRKSPLPTARCRLPHAPGPLP